MAAPDRIAVVYARALSGAAASAGALDAVDEAFEALVAAWRAEPSLRAFLTSPTLGVEVKRKALNLALASAPPVFLHFLAVVLDKGRASALPAIQEAFRDQRDRSAGRIRAQAVTAVAMSPEQAGGVRKGLEEKLGGEVVLEPEVRAAVLGGIRLTIGDWVADATLAHRLRELSKRVHSAQPADGAWVS